MTRLLALVSAPPLEAARRRRGGADAATDVAMVVVITSSGAVSKRLVKTQEPLDPGLVSWAAEYLNERVAGLQLGTHQLRQRFDDPGLSVRERAFLAHLRPAFTQLERGQRLFVGGAASLLGEVREQERRVPTRDRPPRATGVVLALLGSTLRSQRPLVRIGKTWRIRHCTTSRSSAPATGSARPLGAVSLIGPVRMDYEKAINSVRSAAFELSRCRGGLRGQLRPGYAERR